MTMNKKVYQEVRAISIGREAESSP